MRRSHSRIGIASPLLLATLVACGGRASYVKVDQVALGRVVVYRNGVAYYERRATVEGGELTISVPRDRVDDFLKSLTVVDAISRQPLPVSIPRRTDDDGAYLTMRLQLPGRERADVLLTYVTESPAWKPSYRVVVGANNKVMLEGWAVVDNVSGEDWKNILVGVGSSSALSFRYDLWSVRSIERETLQDEARFAIAPPQGVSPYGAPVPETVVVDFDAVELEQPKVKQPVEWNDITVTGRRQNDLKNQPAVRNRRVIKEDVADRALRAKQAAELQRRQSGRQLADECKTNAICKEGTAPRKEGGKEGDWKFNGEYWNDELGYYRKGVEKLRIASEQLKKSNATIVIEATADSKTVGARDRAIARATTIKNRLVDQGIAPGRITITTRVEVGLPEHAQLRIEPAKPGETKPTKPQVADVSAAPVGESHFTSPGPMTVERGASAMVSMVRSETDGEVVYLYDAETVRGNQHFAFRAVRFKNPTASTLEAGPVTVYGDQRFIGEGLTEPVPPNQPAIVPYALDRQIVVDRSGAEDSRLSRLVTVQRGVMTAEVQQIKRTKLSIINRLDAPATVFVRQTVERGWTLIDKPLPFERAGDAHLFRIELAPRETKRVEIAMATPVQRTFDLGADDTLAMIKMFVELPDGDAGIKDQLRKALALHKRLVDLTVEQTSLRRRLDDYKQRLDDLHAQIVTLQAVRTGNDLMAHLKLKMTEMSDRVQKTTISIVDQEQKIMLSRVQFQDAVSDLSLPDAIAGKP
jgi:hypothetical protein